MINSVLSTASVKVPEPEDLGKWCDEDGRKWLVPQPHAESAPDSGDFSIFSKFLNNPGVVSEDDSPRRPCPRNAR